MIVAEESVRSEIRDRVAVATLDDGKANVVSHALIEALNAHLDRAEQETAAVLIAGRPGMFSGGFDLAVMRGGSDAVFGLVRSGALLFLRILEYRLPVVVAATGHAIAAGAITLLCADARLGAAGKFKIGLNEVGAGMTLPRFAMEMARNRLSKRAFVRATTQAELFDPAAAVDVGFLDRVLEPDELFEAALAEARRLGDLPQPAFGATKRSANAALVESLRGSLDADLRLMTGAES
jgi:enoyl-CoA hydratase